MGKAISDPVHGTIELSDVETDIIGTQPFQRLRAVKHLGMGSTVFPGADFSRFSHSLGVCHTTAQIIKALRRNGEDIEEKDEQKYRLAGLLHDIGHYPFSHTVEHAALNHYTSAYLDDIDGSDAESKKAMRHEDVGELILQSDGEIGAILKRSGIDPREVSDIFTRNHIGRLTNTVSSDLDADRIDYLLRTSHHAGLPYGKIDLAYLLTQIRVDKEGRICYRKKAIRAIDHMLLARYFDYQQVAYNKTVVGFEELLERSVKDLLTRGSLDLSAKSVRTMVASGQWSSLTDNTILSAIKDIAEGNDATPARVRARCITRRIAPKMVYSREELDDREEKDSFRTRGKLITQHIQQWADKFGVPRELWFIWSRNTTLTKVGSRIPTPDSADTTNDTEDAASQVVRVHNEADGSSIPITRMKQAFMSILADKAYRGQRIYVALDESQFPLAPEIEKRIKQDLDN